MQNQGAIIAENLVKVYNGKVRAVEGVSFNVAPGEIFGFLGPNGAGKTTTVSMLSAGLRPTEGRAIIDGLEVSHNAEAVKRRIGVIFQEATADGDLTGRENLEVAAGTYGISRAEGRSRATALIEEMHLTDAADRYSKTYSGGMRRRLELAVGLVHRPKILFLDEPTLGLDPQGRAGFWGYVQKLRKETGMTVFVTTHYLDEADTMCDRIAIIDHGKIVAEGTPNQLKDRLGGDVVTVRVLDVDLKRKRIALSMRKDAGAEGSRPAPISQGSAKGKGGDSGSRAAGQRAAKSETPTPQGSLGAVLSEALRRK